MRDAQTLRELLQVRNANRAVLDRFNGLYGSALGRKNKTGSPAILIFVSRKIHPRWLSKDEMIPGVLKDTRNNLQCPTDVFEVGDHLDTPFDPEPLIGKQLQLLEQLRGGSPQLSPGSKLSFETVEGPSSGTLAAIVKCNSTGDVGLLTNAHIGEFEGNLLSHPDVRSNVVASVERISKFVPSDLRLGGTLDEPNSRFVTDCAFAKFLPMKPDSRIGIDITTDLRFEVPRVDMKAQKLTWFQIGDPLPLNLDDPELHPIGRSVYAVGSTLGEQTGKIRGFAYEHLDGVRLSHYTDWLIVSEQKGGYFSYGGDSGKLILTEDDNRPVGLLWGGGLLRTDPKLQLQDHSFAIDINLVLSELNIQLLRHIP